jgi:peptide/nickel transport system permease protein
LLGQDSAGPWWELLRDYPLLQGTILVFAGAYILINLLVDLSYGLIDPQVSAK